MTRQHIVTEIDFGEDSLTQSAMNRVVSKARVDGSRDEDFGDIILRNVNLRNFPNIIVDYGDMAARLVDCGKRRELLIQQLLSEVLLPRIEQRYENHKEERQILLKENTELKIIIRQLASLMRTEAFQRALETVEFTYTGETNDA